MQPLNGKAHTPKQGKMKQKLADLFIAILVVGLAGIVLYISTH